MAIARVGMRWSGLMAAVGGTWLLGWGLMGAVAHRKVIDDALEKARATAIPTATHFAARAGCTPDDLIQEAILLVLEDPTRLNLEYPENSFRAIVRNVGKHAATKHRRRLKGVAPTALDGQSHVIDAATPDVAEVTASDEISAIVREEIRSLPRKQQELIERQLRGDSVTDLAKEMGKSEGVVSKEKSRIQSRLRDSKRLRTLMESLSLGPLIPATWRGRGLELKIVAGLIVVAAVTLVSIIAVYPHGANETGNTSIQSSRQAGSSGASNVASSSNVTGSAGSGGSASSLNAIGDGGAASGRNEAGAASVVPNERGASSVAGEEDDAAKRTPAARSTGSSDVVDANLLEHHVRYFANGEPYVRWSTLDGVIHGLQMTFRPDKTLFQTEEYHRGVLHGYVRTYAADGVTLVMFSRYDNGVRVERWEIEDDE